MRYIFETVETRNEEISENKKNHLKKDLIVFQKGVFIILN